MLLSSYVSALSIAHHDRYRPLGYCSWPLLSRRCRAQHWWYVASFISKHKDVHRDLGVILKMTMACCVFLLCTNPLPTTSSRRFLLVCCFRSSLCLYPTNSNMSMQTICWHVRCTKHHHQHFHFVVTFGRGQHDQRNYRTKCS